MTDKLSAKQFKAASMLAEGQACSIVAKALSITPQTISAWKKVALFQATINSITMSHLEKTRTQLQNASSSAVDTLVELARESKLPETRRKAAMDILRLTGFEPGCHDTFAWGVESTTVQQVEKDMRVAKNPELASLLGDLYI